LGGKCVECSSETDLEFDHIDKNSKSFPISRSPSEKCFWEELEKCQLLCKKCHRRKSTLEHQGDNCSHAKLSTIDVKNIREKISMGFSGRQLAKLYGVGPMQISRIKNKKRWVHVI
jgi:5-methylcytosine-specific restriction endonuclease McrA